MKARYEYSQRDHFSIITIFDEVEISTVEEKYFVSCNATSEWRR